MEFLLGGAEIGDDGEEVEPVRRRPSLRRVDKEIIEDRIGAGGSRQQETATAEGGQDGFRDARRTQGGERGIERVAAVLEDGRRRGHGIGVAGGNGASVLHRPGATGSRHGSDMAPWGSRLSGLCQRSVIVTHCGFHGWMISGMLLANTFRHGDVPMQGLRIPAIILAVTVAAAAPGVAADACINPGQWRQPGNGKVIAVDDLMAAMARRPIVLLGEVHDRATHHDWQLHTIAALHGRNPNMVLAFEAFPRSVQDALDRWTQGLTDRNQFLEESRWHEVWRFDPVLYMPLFEFARLHRVPMRAMNTERSLVSRVGRVGWSAVPAESRLGIGDPAPASAAYRKYLKDVFDQHRRQAGASAAEDPADAFDRFVDAQLIWDRAMAEALATARREGGDPLVVGIVGSGHLEYGHGIPHQLADLGVSDAAVLMPWETTRSCADLKTPEGAIADVVFGIAAEKDAAVPWRPLLGVLIEDGEGGVRITRVIEHSVAAAAGLKAGDVVLDAAGAPTVRVADLIRIVRRQAPGTWLPPDRASGRRNTRRRRQVPIAMKRRSIAGVVALMAIFGPSSVHADGRILHHDLDVRLDPERHSITVEDRLEISGGGRIILHLAAGLAVTEFAVDGRRPLPLPHGGDWSVDLGPQGTHRLDIRYAGVFDPDAAVGRGDSARLQIGGAGTYLPAHSAWIPRLENDLFSYRLAVEIPKPHRVVVPGHLKEEHVDGLYRAVVESEAPTDGIVLVAGIYSVTERRHGGIRLRTAFHPRIADLADDYLDSATALGMSRSMLKS